MSGSSSYRTYESDDENSGWSLSSIDSQDDDENELSDELTLFNADEDDNEDSSTFEAFIKLSMRLKEQYNLREATVALERCDKIWDTMQLLKRAQTDRESDNENTDDKDDNDDDNDDDNNDDDDDDEYDDDVERAKSTTDSTISDATNIGVPYIKYQPVQGNGNNPFLNFHLSVKSQKMLYHCVTCGKQYSKKRGLRSHMQREHDIPLPHVPRAGKHTITGETRVTRSHNVDGNTVNAKNDRTNDNSHPVASKNLNDDNAFHCPLCNNKYLWKGSLIKHAMDNHDVDITDCFRGLPKSAAKLSNQQRNIISTTTNEQGEKVMHVSGTRVPGSENYTYTYNCPVCNKFFTLKSSMREHAYSEHRVVVVKGRMRETRKGITEVSSKITSNSKETPVESENVKKAPSNQRAGPKSSKRKVGRPKRSCAGSTSYTEPTNAEEEVLEREIFGPLSLKPSNTTKCFLCKNRYVDIRRHLKDYHRINSPDSVLPLNEKISQDDRTVTSEKNEKTIERDNNDSPATLTTDDDVYKGLYRPVKSEKNVGNKAQPQQCVMCLYIYSSIACVKRHLGRYLVDGVVKEHEAFVRKTKSESNVSPLTTEKNIDEPITDPLAITDFPDTSGNDDNSSVNESVVKSRKRCGNNSSSDESFTTTASEETHVFKRRKIINIIREKKNYNVVRDNNEVESVNAVSDRDIRYNGIIDDDDDDDDEEEDKGTSQRDTRDSSDRDSGIGISITIKKRNNSYEVVDRDTCAEDDKIMEEANVKNPNLLLLSTSDASTTATTMTRIRCRSEDELLAIGSTRKREIFDTLDCSAVDDRAPTTMTTQGIITKRIKSNDNDDDVVIIDDTVVGGNGMDSNVGWTDDCKGEEACENMPGKVSSLRSMCRNVLKSDETAGLMSNDQFFHQCPVCCRFYPTERDVTIHMLEHKVSRTNFRTTRLHGIPSSALRRYGRRNV